MQPIIFIIYWHYILHVFCPCLQGYYMYTEASGANPDETASLLSPVQPATTGKCLHFYYHMSGTGMGTLMVSIRAETVNTILWRRFSDQGDVWHAAQVSINSNFQYQVDIKCSIIEETSYSLHVLLSRFSGSRVNNCIQ